ncbi:hypothetical protein JCM1393_26610 [Clostridium carnis]
MGRKEKIVKINIKDDKSKNIDRREIGYYSTPYLVGRYITKRMLTIASGKKVLDPCCGKEELIEYFLKERLYVDGFDIISHKDDYVCNFTKLDFINYYCSKKKESKNKELTLDYDYYILNPPYNCHEVNYIRANKEKLKYFFSDVGVYNMYSMFISSVIDLAKDRAVIGIITHDSFFYAKSYKKLRKKILETCTIHEITMCPTNLFKNQGADVRTSILILQKGVDNQRKIVVNNRPSNIKNFYSILENNLNSNFKGNFNLEDIILKNDNLEFIIECPLEIRILFNSYRLGDIYKCVTGISTGDDKKFLSLNKVEPYTIPFYKNPGKDRFYTDKCIYLHNDFLNLEKKLETFIVRNKNLLYKGGISCSSMGVDFTACILPENSTYGVNPNIICKDNERWWLLAYLNSSLVTYIVRGVLIRSNMITSGYVSRIPIIDIDDLNKDKLTNLAKRIYTNKKEGLDCKIYFQQIDNLIFKLANLSNFTIEIIMDFKKNLIKNT